MEKIYFLSSVLRVYRDSHGIYGAPKIKVALEEFNLFVSVKTVSNAMRILGIRSVVSKNFPKKQSRLSLEEKALIVNLIKHRIPSSINEVWTTDITFIHTVYDGTLYLISFIDLYSRKVVGWHLAFNMKTEMILVAFEKAIKKRKPNPGLIIHSDKGAQMRSALYRNTLSKHNCVFSYTSLHHSCDENPHQESWHSLLKKEWLSERTLYHFEDAYKTIFDYIEGFYNPIRLHSSIGYFSPDCFEISNFPF